MTLHSVSDPAAAKARPKGFALFELGFRPLFLAAALAAVVSMGLWLAFYVHGWGVFNYYPAAQWHGHEMVFGFALAVVGGFLLTAVRNWTNIATLHGFPLALLAALWLAGRILPLLPAGLPYGLVAAVDIAFLLALTAALAVPIVQARHGKSLVFPLLILALGAIDLLFHLRVAGVAGGSADALVVAAVYLMVVVVVIMGGRVIPFFTERGLPGTTVKSWPWIEKLAAPSVTLLALAQAAYPQPWLLAALAALAALLQGIRLAGWVTAKALSVPLLWVLHLGYLWMVLGLALTALGAVGAVSPFAGLHLLTVGAIGTIALGMMARVSLAHTGRMLQPSLWMTTAFWLLHLGVVVRAILPLILPRWYGIFMGVSGVLWVLAFLFFLLVYTPILLRPRSDGQPARFAPAGRPRPGGR